MRLNLKDTRDNKDEQDSRDKLKETSFLYGRKKPEGGELSHHEKTPFS